MVSRQSCRLVSGCLVERPLFGVSISMVRAWSGQGKGQNQRHETRAWQDSWPFCAQPLDFPFVSQVAASWCTCVPCLPTKESPDGPAAFRQPSTWERLRLCTNKMCPLAWRTLNKQAVKPPWAFDLQDSKMNPSSPERGYCKDHECRDFLCLTLTA